MKRGMLILLTGMTLLLTACGRSNSGEEKRCILPQEIVDVILKDAVFISTDEENAEVKLSEFCFFNGEKTDDILKTGQYAIVDLDCDGYNEVILEVFSDTPEPQLEVFRLEDGMVYGYQFPYRAMSRISVDGVIGGSSGAAYNITYRLSFEGDTYEEVVLASDRDGKYYIGSEETEGTEYKDYIDRTFKQQVEWCDDYSRLK